MILDSINYRMMVLTLYVYNIENQNRMYSLLDLSM